MVIKKSFFLLSLLILFQLTFVSPGDVTGKVVSSPIDMSITVESDFTLISIITPENKTYLTNESLNLSYLVSNEDSVWYNLDNSANITITGSVLFNVSEGQHTLYLYANSSLGNLSVKNVTFNADSSLLNIIYDEYKGNTRGDSTHFEQIAFEDLQNISGIILENTDFGKIIFSGDINISEDADASDSVLDLDSNIEISSNLIVLNSSALPNFNTSATLSLYGLSFSNPRILMGGSICPESICTEINYPGGVLVFNVSHFSNYSAEETPVASVTPSGGGSARISGDSFYLSTETMSVSVKIREITTKEIIVTNLDNKKLNFNIEVYDLDNLIIVRPNKFSLNQGESKTISLEFIARENQSPELYLGKIIFKAGSKTKEVLISVDVESKQALFDIDIEIPKEYHLMIAGDELRVTIELINMGENGKIDVEIEYFIKDSEGNVMDYHQDILSIVTTLSFIEKFYLPPDLKPGKYILHIKMNYRGKVASASEWFSIIEESYPQRRSFIEVLTILIGILILAGILVIIFIIIKHKKKPIRKDIEKISYLKLIKKRNSIVNKIFKDFSNRFVPKFREQKTQQKSLKSI